MKVQNSGSGLRLKFGVRFQILIANLKYSQSRYTAPNVGQLVQRFEIFANLSPKRISKSYVPAKKDQTPRL